MTTHDSIEFLDRHGSLTILLAVFLQTCGAIWWASGVQSSLDSIKLSITRFSRIDDMESRLQVVEKYGSLVTVQHFNSLEVRISQIESDLKAHMQMPEKR